MKLQAAALAQREADTPRAKPVGRAAAPAQPARAQKEAGAASFLRGVSGEPPEDPLVFCRVG